MLVYENTKVGFLNDNFSGIIADRIDEEFKKHHLTHGDAEFRAWENSLSRMATILDDNEIDGNCKIAIEYQIPLTSKRVDFLISGKDDNDKLNVVVVELKQWEDSDTTDKEDLVEAFTGGRKRLVTHPSYQAYSYAKIITNFNEKVLENDISLIPCAYLHNYKERNRNHIDNDLYKNAISLAPIFLQQDNPKLREFIKKYIKKKADIDLLMTIENGRLKPARALQDSLSSMLKGNKEFEMIDEQKVVFETVKKTLISSLKEVNKSTNLNKKYTIIVQGGPGTGKTVVAIQLLVDLINKGYAVNYVTKNSAPREVYFVKLKQNNFKLNYIKSLFVGSGSFIDTPSNYFDCLIVDEAHRLNAKSGIFHNKGENQVKEIINASKVSVFFIDEDQIVTTQDVGSVELIKEYAKELGSEIIEGENYNLISQFRCDGSDGYLAFLDNLLGIKETANYTFDVDYDIKLFNDPNKMREELRKKNDNNKARMLAGYCYEWVSKKELNKFDINLENNFHARWNFANTNTWAIDEDSFDQVGCIHTSQGLEFDYVGVIIGRDLRFENYEVVTDFTKRAKTDQSLKGIKTTKNYNLADKIIRNTYKVLLSRAQKGCYIYSEDKELLKYIAKMLNKEIIY